MPTTISGSTDDSDELRDEALASAEDELDTADEPDHEGSDGEEANKWGAYLPYPWPHHHHND
jgi:hypothetical protein